MFMAATRHMALRAAVLSVCMLIGSAASAADPVDAPAPDPETVKVQKIGPSKGGFDRLTMQVQLGDHGPFRFIIDTGSQRTVIARDLLDRLAIQPDGSANIISMTGRSRVATVSLPELRYGEAAIGALSAPVLERENIGGHGLLGLDSLENKQLTMDFRSNNMRITRSGKVRLSRDPDVIIVEARRKLGQLILVDSRVGTAKVDVILDTGAEISIGNMALKDKLKERDLLLTPVPITLTSVTGDTIAAEYSVVRSIEVGGMTLKNASIVFTDAPPFVELGLHDKPAMLLGMQMIRLFDTVSIDFGKRKVQFELPEAQQGYRVRLMAMN